jgi:membrane-associated phospholipid phosphatase
MESAEQIGVLQRVTPMVRQRGHFSTWETGPCLAAPGQGGSERMAWRRRESGSALLALALAIAIAAAASPAPVGASEIARDAQYLIDNAQLDLVDIATSPLHAADENSVLRSPTFYLVLAGVAGVWGASFALDQTIRSHLRNMSASDADLLQHVSYASVGAAAASLYLYGYSIGDSSARDDAITGAESAGVASLVNLGFKYGFGRLRPEEDGHDHTAFFRGGQSLFSGEVTPVFSLAAGVSEYFENRWYVAAPIYSLALVDGFGRIGHDAHWFSDVVGAAFLGAGTTELLLYLHRQHEQQPDRWRLFPASVSPMATHDGPIKVSGLAGTWTW